MIKTLILFTFLTSLQSFALEEDGSKDRDFSYNGMTLTIPGFKKTTHGTSLATKSLKGLVETFTNSKIKVTEAIAITSQYLNPELVKKTFKQTMIATAQMCFASNIMPKEDNLTQDNEVDALRHYFMGFFLAQQFGVEKARVLLLAHESWPKIDQALELRNMMDLYNNEIGFEDALRFKALRKKNKRGRYTLSTKRYIQKAKILAEARLSNGDLFVWGSGKEYVEASNQWIDRSNLCTRDIYPNYQEIFQSGIIYPLQ